MMDREHLAAAPNEAKKRLAPMRLADAQMSASGCNGRGQQRPFRPPNYWLFTSARGVKAAETGRGCLHDVPPRCLLGHSTPLSRLLCPLEFVQPPNSGILVRKAADRSAFTI